MGVALSGGDPGVAENLLHDPDVDTLLYQQGRRRVPSVVNPGIPYAGLLEDGLPLLPVLRALDRAAELRGEDQIVIGPPGSMAGRHRLLGAIDEPCFVPQHGSPDKVVAVCCRAEACAGENRKHSWAEHNGSSCSAIGGGTMDWVVEWVRAAGDFPFPLVAAVAGFMGFAESGLGVGSVFPGETGVLLLGATATTPIRFAVMLLVVAVGVTGGDHVGYWLGRRYGERLRDSRLVKRLGVRHWDRAMAALQRYGAAAVFVTRLVPVVRTLTPAAAGASKVPYGRFLPASLAGSLLWSAVYVSLGAFASASAARLAQTLGHGAWIVFGLMAAFIIVAVRMRNKRALRQSAERQEQDGSSHPHHG